MAPFTAEEHKALARQRWGERLTSLWAPVTLLAIALIPYLLAVELSPGSVGWALPAMRFFGALMAAAFFGLAGRRLASPRARALRKARHHAREQLVEVETLLSRARGLGEKERERILEQARTLELRLPGVDAAVIDAEAHKLGELAERHLAAHRRSAGVEMVSGLMKALLLALVLRSVLIEPFRIPTGSMIPTLEIGDQIFVNKYIYGVRIPFTNWVPFIIVRPPRRGDVVVFNNPVQSELDFVKRVVGVPGDRVELRDDVVFVNGVEQARQIVDGNYSYWDYREREDRWQRVSAVLFSEDLDGHRHTLLQDSEKRGGGLEGPFLVPPEHVFVMGDNRDNSLDSRYGLGGPRQAAFVPYGNIKGKAMIIWFSWTKDGLGAGLFGRGLDTRRLFLPVR